MTGPGIPRQGNPIVTGGERVGEVTSGTHVPVRSRSGSGWATSAADLAEPGTGIEIDVRGKRRPAEIRKRPLYSKD